MIYVMSDIHGNLRRFNSIMEQIKLTDKDTLYVLGDVIDRYPDGIRILRKLMAMDTNSQKRLVFDETFNFQLSLLLSDAAFILILFQLIYLRVCF